LGTWDWFNYWHRHVLICEATGCRMNRPMELESATQPSKN
jgi:hypothetical protein